MDRELGGGGGMEDQEGESEGGRAEEGWEIDEDSGTVGWRLVGVGRKETRS